MSAQATLSMQAVAQTILHTEQGSLFRCQWVRWAASGDDLLRRLGDVVINSLGMDPLSDQRGRQSSDSWQLFVSFHVVLCHDPEEGGRSTWVNSCDEATSDDHCRIPEPPAEAHQSTPHKHQHGGPHQRPFPGSTKPLLVLSARDVGIQQLLTDLPYLVTSLPTSRAPVIPPMAKMDTVMEYSTVRRCSSGGWSWRSSNVSL